MGIYTAAMFYFLIVFVIYIALLCRNPIFSVLYLIFAFITVGSLLIYLTIDYLAILIIMIYGGAISILIMFVIMFVDLQQSELEYGKSLFLVNFFNIGFMFFGIVYIITCEDSHILYEFLYYINWYEVYNMHTNIEAIGIALFNFYIFEFLITGFLLFFSMIVVINLVQRNRYNSKSQNLYGQLTIRKSSLMVTVN